MTSKATKGFNAPASHEGAQCKTYLALTMNQENYAIDILKIQGLLIYKDLSVKSLMNMPPYLKGVFQMSGEIIPLIDLRTLYHLKAVDFNEATVVVVLKTEPRLMGVIVDSVLDLISLSEDALKPCLETDDPLYGEHIESIATQEGNIFTVLKVENLISHHKSEEFRRTLDEAVDSLENTMLDRKG